MTTEIQQDALLHPPLDPFLFHQAIGGVRLPVLAAFDHGAANKHTDTACRRSPGVKGVESILWHYIREQIVNPLYSQVIISMEKQKSMSYEC